MNRLWTAETIRQSHFLLQTYIKNVTNLHNASLWSSLVHWFVLTTCRKDAVFCTVTPLSMNFQRTCWDWYGKLNGIGIFFPTGDQSEQAWTSNQSEQSRLSERRGLDRLDLQTNRFQPFWEIRWCAMYKMRKLKSFLKVLHVKLL